MNATSCPARFMPSVAIIEVTRAIAGTCVSSSRMRRGTSTTQPEAATRTIRRMRIHPPP